MTDPAQPSDTLRERQDALRKLCAEATPGPWYDNLNDLIGGRCVGTVNVPAHEGPGSDDVAEVLAPNNAAFIAACSPDVISALLDQLKDAEQRAEAHETVLRENAVLHQLNLELERESRALKEHILDIDAHATPYGDIPEEPGWIGTYLVTAGALHRALGKIGHSAPSCQAEADLSELRRKVEDYQEALRRYEDLERAARQVADIYRDGDKVAIVGNIVMEKLRAALAQLSALGGPE